MDMSQYLQMFLEESREHLQSLNKGLLELEGNPNNIGVLNEVFRSAHTLKGMSATMGYDKVATLTHAMEDIMDKLRSQEVPVTGTILDLLFKCVDALEDMVAKIADGEEHDLDVSGLISELRGGPAQAAAALAVEEVEAAVQVTAKVYLNEYETNLLANVYEKGFQGYLLRVDIEPNCVMKAARAYMVFKNLENIGEIIKSIPTVQEIEDENFESSFQVVVVTKEPQEKTRECVLDVSEIASCEITPLGEPAIPGPVAKEAVQVSSVPSSTPQKAEQKQADLKPEAKAEEQQKGFKANQTVRVDIDRLDKLMNLVGELVISKTRLEQISSSNNLVDLNETTEHMDRITTELQSIVMKVRMVPIEQVFNRFPRMVRDLAKDLGKELELIIEGKETELDRTIIDEIGDPLVHLLRNSIDHGIESPQERLQAGKTNPAQVYLKAKHEGNNVVIQVSDDGRGIDWQKVLEKSIEKGIVTAKEAEQMDRHTALNLIFAPGCSTAERVTDVSGRGVGLDAVKNRIQNLGGNVQLHTKKGYGSRFTIQLPLTLAIIQALLVRVGNEHYAIPLSSVVETTIFSPNQIKKVQEQEVVVLRGNVLPVVSLHKLLDVPRTETQEIYTVVVHKGGEQAGLMVDELIGQQEIVIKSLGNLLVGIPGIAGATILGNGQVSLILDVATLF